MEAKSGVRRKSKSGAAPEAKKGKRWVAGVKTVSTFPPEGLFTRSADFRRLGSTVPVFWLKI
jgi:hypothetical protein